MGLVSGRFWAGVELSYGLGLGFGWPYSSGLTDVRHPT